MAHHFTKAKSQRQNSEKASVAQIVAQNNETLSKLIDGERTKLGFNNKNASDYIKSSTSDNAVAQVRQEAYEKTTPLNEGWVGELGSVIVDKVQGAYEFMSSDEGIDRRGVDGSGQEYLTSDTRIQQALDDEIVNRSEQAFQNQNDGVDKFTEKFDAEKAAASSVFMSNYNDDQVFTPNLEEALNNEILKTTTEDIKETVTKAEDLKTAELQKSIAIVNQKVEEQRVSELAAMKKLGLSDDNAPYVQDKEKGTYETDNMTVYRPREIEFEKEAETKAQEIKDKLEAEKLDNDTLEAQNQFWSNGENDGEEERLRQKEISESQDKWTDNNQYVERHGAEIQREIAEFEKDDTLVDRHPVFDKTKAELAAEKNVSAAELDRLKSNASTNTIGAGVVQREEEAELKAQALREKMAAYDSSKYKATTSHLKSNKNKPEKSKIPDKYATFGDKRGKPDLLVGSDPFRFTTLNYPSDITTSPEYGHYMLFYVNVQNKTKYKYHGYNDDGNYKTIGDVVESQRIVYEGAEAGGAGVDPDTTNLKYRTYYDYNTGAGEQGLADDISYLRGGVQAGRPGNVLQSNQVTLMRQRPPTDGIGARVDLTSRITDSVALYLPPDVTSNVSASYTGFDMGLLGYLALGGADIINQVKSRDFEGAARNFLGTGERMLTEMIKKAGITAVDAAFGGTGGTEQIFNKVFGQTTNPFIEVAFNNMSLREFSYTFNFRPKSSDETEEVKAIIQLFRFHMAPELKGTNHRYMTLPSTFDIHYMYQSDPETATENTFYNKIATCVLERCDVNYTPTGVRSFDDGAPTEISMTLGFKETELLTKNKINKGF